VGCSATDDCFSSSAVAGQKFTVLSQQVCCEFPRLISLEISLRLANLLCDTDTLNHLRLNLSVFGAFDDQVDTFKPEVETSNAKKISVCFAHCWIHPQPA